MNHPSLQVYTLVSRWSLLKNYQGKIMVVAFWGTHVPLLTLLLYFIMSASLSASTTVRVLLIALS
ncbi:MAG: GGDEF-domain containing protein, partial [Chloroflexi bacterium]